MRLTKLRYTVREAAELLSVCDRTVENRIKEGVLPVVREGRKILIRAKDLEAYDEGRSNPQLARAKKLLRVG